MTIANVSAMKSPVRFMARGLAEQAGDENPVIASESTQSGLLMKIHCFVAYALAMRGTPSQRRRRGMGRQRWRRLERAWRLAPGAGIAAGDQPVDEAGDDPRAGHDFEMPADDALEAHRLGVERDQAKIAGETDQTATDRVSEHAADVKRFGDQNHDQ